MASKLTKIVVGLSLQADQAQVTYFYPSLKEPETLMVDKEDGTKTHVISISRAVWNSAAGLGEGISTLNDFFRDILIRVAGEGHFDCVHIMVTVPYLERLISTRIPQSLTMLGIPRKNIFLQDHQSSFYWYAVNQRKELYNGDVALIEMTDDRYQRYVMHIDRSKSPALVGIEKRNTLQIRESDRGGRDDEAWEKEKDRLFFEFLKKVFERKNVVTCYLMGDSFDPKRASRSFSFLTSGRHAFMGDNLYTKGACFAAMERCGLLPGKDMLFMGRDIISDNISMYLRVKGKEVYYPLISAGINWYEAHYECDIIPDGENSITLHTKPMTGGEETAHIMLLENFPDRPQRASRIRMTIYFTDARTCCVEAEDLGFGGFFRPSGMKWSRRIILK
ncbi:MAG: hypothetical protein J6S83_13485 [Lachnospiraceae bacterium]|nr:hypothetical protein [Lachnospiraceae bacterium]